MDFGLNKSIISVQTFLALRIDYFLREHHYSQEIQADLFRDKIGASNLLCNSS